MDMNGDAEGNYTLVYRKLMPGSTDQHGLFPIGDFRYSGGFSGLPVSTVLYTLLSIFLTLSLLNASVLRKKEPFSF